MNRLIESEELLKKLDSLYREEDCEIGDGGVVTSSWATVDYGEVVEKVNQAPTIHAIPTDKVKALIHQLNEEKELAYADFDEYKASVLGIEADELPEDEYRYGIERCLQLLNRLIAEEVEHEQNKC